MDVFSTTSVKPLSFSRDVYSTSSVNSPVNIRTATSTLFGSVEARAEFSKRISFWVISVEGYDTWLPADDIKSALKNHFGSCGVILRVDLVDRRASLVIIGDDADEKALELNGSEVAGGKLVVKAAPLPKLELRNDIPFGATVSQVHQSV